MKKRFCERCKVKDSCLPLMHQKSQKVEILCPKCFFKPAIDALANQLIKDSLLKKEDSPPDCQRLWNWAYAETKRIAEEHDRMVEDAYRGPPKE